MATIDALPTMFLDQRTRKPKSQPLWWASTFTDF